MSKNIFFGPGPSQLYPSMNTFFEDALKEDVGSISHRSGAYQEIHKGAVDNLRKLINLPDNYSVFFLGSATEAWERIFQNFVDKKSFHFTNGSFSQKFFEYAVESGIDATPLGVPLGQGFSNMGDISISLDTDLIAVTHNETSAGVSVPLEEIYALRKANPSALIAVDMVSSLPYPNIDFNQIDTAFFSVQKCFGLPAGLGVWLVNDRCIKKCEELKATGKRIGPHHDLPELIKRAKVNQTPSTPNILGIYLLKRVTEAMLAKGIDTLRSETDVKAKALYNYIERSKTFSFGVENKAHQSQTVIVANTPILPSEINEYLAPFDLVIGAGYGAKKASQIRIANFPAHSIEKVNLLIKKLEEMYG